MNWTEAEILQQIELLEQWENKFHNMMIADGWVITGNGAEDPNGNTHLFKDCIDRYTDWKLVSLGWKKLDVDVYHPASKSKDYNPAKWRMYRSPMGRVYTFLDARRVVEVGDESKVWPSVAYKGFRLTQLFPDDSTTLVVEFRRTKDDEQESGMEHDYFRLQ